METVLNILTFLVVSNIICVLLAMAGKDNKREFVGRLLFTNLINSFIIGIFML